MNSEKHALVLLAGGMKELENGIWASTDLTEEDAQKSAPGGKLRVLAAAILMRQHPEWMLVTGGDKGFDVPAGSDMERASIADTLRRELVACGVDETRILLERESNTTFQELQALERLIHVHSFVRVSLLTNRWHVPRLKAMLEAKFPTLINFCDIIEAEDVVIDNDSQEWKTFIDRAYAAAFMEKRMEKERHGIAQIKEGTYQYQ